MRKLSNTLEVRQLGGNGAMAIMHRCNDAIIETFQSEKEAKERLAILDYAPELLDELEKAHVIIKCMLQEIPQEAKSTLAKYFIRQGISDEGMTRANERESIIAKAKGT